MQKLFLYFLLLAFPLAINPSEADQQPRYHELDQATKKQIDCLAKNIYFESNGEPHRGQLAVGLVTLNRASSQHFPSTVCEVVKQKTKSSCQFSWWCNDAARTKAIEKSFSKKELEAYYDIRELATWLYLNYGKIPDITRGALFFHATYINPQWRGVRKTIRIGNHIFYRRA